MALHTPDHNTHDPEDEDEQPKRRGLLSGAVELGLAMHPVTGGLMAARETVGAIRDQRPGLAALAALGMIPGVPGGMAKGVAKGARVAQRELRALRTRFTKPIREALDAGDDARAGLLSRQMAAARPGGFARVGAQLDEPITEGGGVFRVSTEAGDAIPGKVDVQFIDGDLDVIMPVSDAAMAGQQQLGNAGIRAAGRQIIEAFEAAGHKVESVSGFRASGARSAGTGGQSSNVLKLPRSFFFREPRSGLLP